MTKYTLHPPHPLWYVRLQVRSRAVRRGPRYRWLVTLMRSSPRTRRIVEEQEEAVQIGRLHRLSPELVRMAAEEAARLHR